jgi:pimeloyl-ACP methyl ester carboxylesterase
MNASDIRSRRIAANGMTFDSIEAGEGPLVLCLHGFPDNAATWSPLLIRLAQEGFRAVATPMRGYTPNTKAPDGCYQPWATGGDAIALIEALGYQSAHVVGHDWGSSAAYAAAALRPDLVEKLVTLAVPYGPALRNAILADGDQQRRSWYWFFFQLPFAEMAIAHDDYAFVARLWAEWSPGYVLPREDWAALKALFAEPGVLPEVLGYYRQMFTGQPEWAERAAKAGGPITVPTLYLHGADDGCIGADLGEGMEAHFPAGLRRIVVEGAGHFLHREEPQRVGDEIVAFLKG